MKIVSLITALLALCAASVNAAQPAASNAKLPMPTLLSDNGYLLMLCDSATMAERIIKEQTAIAGTPAYPTDRKDVLKVAGSGNIMDNPQGFSKALGSAQLAVPHSVSDQIYYLVLEDGKWKGVEGSKVNKNKPTYVIFYKQN